jgi:hypothetical protein
MIHALSPRVGCANFTTVEEIPPHEDVLAGTFFLFEHSIIILFDSGASHNFMNLAYAQKAKLTLWGGLCKHHILLALLEAEWLMIVWSIKSHSSVLGEHF